MKKHFGYIDTLRAMAAYFVFILHFVTWAAPLHMEKFVALFAAVPGLNTSFSVLVFSILLGYFARNTKENTIIYIVKRYLQFTLVPFAIHICIYACFVVMARFMGIIITQPLFAQYYGHYTIEIIQSIFSDVFSLNPASYYRVLWTLSPFFMASVLLIVLAKLFCTANKYLELFICAALIVVLLSFENSVAYNTPQWIAFCLLGYAARCVENLSLPIFSMKRCTTAILLISLSALTQLRPTPLNLIWQGIFFCLFLLALQHIRTAQKALSIPPLVYLGKISFHIYMWHLFIICACTELLQHFGITATWPALSITLNLLISASITILIASASYYIYDIWFVRRLLAPLLTLATLHHKQAS